MKKKQFLAVVLSAVILSIALAGCGQTVNSVAGAGNSGAVSTSQAAPGTGIKTGSAETISDGTVDSSDELAFPLGNRVDSSSFTGDVYLSSIITLDDTYNFPSTNNIIFSPGARSSWHTHGGMIILGTGGIGYYQEEGKPAQILHPGDVAFCPPGVKHWHGGSADTQFAHIAINTNPELTGLEWFDRISPEEYGQLSTETSQP